MLVVPVSRFRQQLVFKSPTNSRLLATLDNAWLSIISVHELSYGLGLLPKGNRGSELEEKIQRLLSEYSDLVIPVDQSEAVQAALFRVQARQQGRVINLADSLIAGTAKVHHLLLATRNVDDFSIIDIEIINPWIKK